MEGTLSCRSGSTSVRGGTRDVGLSQICWDSADCYSVPAVSIASQELNLNNCSLGVWRSLMPSLAETATVRIVCTRSNLAIGMN